MPVWPRFSQSASTAAASDWWRPFFVTDTAGFAVLAEDWVVGGEGQAQGLRRGLGGQQFSELGLLLRIAIGQDCPGNEGAGLGRCEGIPCNSRGGLQRFYQT